MPLAHVAAHAALVGAESFAIAGEPVCLIVERVMTFGAVGHASAVAGDFTLTQAKTETPNHS